MTNFWDERYQTDEYVFGEQPNAFLASQVDLVRRHRRALAVADGEGLAKARRLAARRGVEIETVLADLAAFDWPENAFDLVVAIFIQFADPPLRSAIFGGIKRTLRPGGTLILEGYRSEQLGYGTGGPGELDKLYTLEMLEQAFADMETVHLRAQDSAITEGKAHAGMSALLDLIARKPL